MPILILMFLLLTGCSDSNSDSTAPYPHPYTTQEFQGRDTGLPPYQRHWIYRAKVPVHWVRVVPLSTESLLDTMKPLSEFLIKDDAGTGQVKIAIHNFPSDHLNARIAPMAQILRWKKQFSSLDPTSEQLIPQAFGGFSGFLFVGSGTLSGQENLSMMLAWTMQIYPEHYQSLSLAFPGNEGFDRVRQMRADYTLKVTGPKQLVEKNREAIMSFATSFELIHEIPLRQ